MAEMMGGGGHHSHAPLSGSQTLSIAKHLQDQLCEMQARLDDFQAEYSRTKEQMQAMQQGLRKDFEAVHSLQDGASGLNALIDSTRKDLSRTNMCVHQLSAKMDDTTKNVSDLREAHKQAGMAMAKMNSEVQHCISVTTGVRDDVEKQVNSEITRLREDFSRMNLLVSRLNDDQNDMKVQVQTSKEEHRAQHLANQNMKDDMAKTNTMLQVLDQRTAEMSKCLKKTRQIVDDQTNTCTKMEEDHEKLRGEVVEVFGGLKSVSNTVRSVQEVLEKTSNGLNATQGQLANACQRWDQTRQELDVTKSNVRSLKEAHEIGAARTQELAGQLETTKIIAAETKRGLLDTNQLVLPNLNMGSGMDGPGLPRKPFSARDFAGSGSRPLNLKPLPKKVAAPGATGTKGDASPEKFMDRMAWI